MSEIADLEMQLAEALARLRQVVINRPEPAGEAPLHDRIALLEKERNALKGELERLRDKRDRDVAALDELISQLKPLIEEV